MKTFALIPIDRILGTADIYSVRSEPTAEALSTLRDDIATFGMTTPIEVTIDDAPIGFFRLVHGFQRFHAIRSLGWNAVYVGIK